MKLQDNKRSYRKSTIVNEHCNLRTKSVLKNLHKFQHWKKFPLLRQRATKEKKLLRIDNESFKERQNLVRFLRKRIKLKTLSAGIKLLEISWVF